MSACASTNDFPFFNNTEVQDRGSYEKHMQVGCEWDSLQTFQRAMELYQLRCNLRITQTGTMHHRKFVCGNEKFDCNFIISIQYSKKSTHWNITKFISHNCSPSMKIQSNPLHIATLEHLLVVHGDVETMKPSQIKILLDAQQLFPVDVSDGYKSNVSMCLLDRLRGGNHLDNVNGIHHFKRLFENLDHDNKFSIEVNNENTYTRSQAIFGPVARMVRHDSTIKWFDFDGAHLKKSRGTLLALVLSDANNCWHILSLSHECQEESTAVWDAFYLFIYTHFPNAFDENALYCSDRDGGIMCLLSGLEETKINKPIASFMGICIAHLKRNCYHLLKASTKGDRDRINLLIDPVIFGETIYEHDAAMENVKSTNDKLYKYLLEIKKVKYCKAYSKRSIKMTSNSVESTWSSLMDVRNFNSIVKIYYRVYEKVVNKVNQQINIVENFQARITPFAEATLLHNIKCSYNQRAHFSSKGNIVKTDKGSFKCSISERSCTCRSPNIREFPCCHLIYMFQKKNLLGNAESMVDPLLSTRGWKSSLHSSMPLNPINFSLKDIDEKNPFTAPLYFKLRGRPKSKKQNRAKLPRRSSSKKDLYTARLHEVEIGIHENRKKRQRRTDIESNLSRKRIPSRGEPRNRVTLGSSICE